jgi:hypothetical protein
MGLALFAFLCGGGGRWCWHYSQCIVGCGCRRSWSSSLLLLLLCPCGGGRYYGDEGRGHDDDLDPFFVVWIRPTLFLGSTFGIANNDNTKDEREKEKREEGVGNGY